MIGTVMIAAAYLLPALVARRRKMGFTRALLLSLLLSPLFALPLALKSKRNPKTPKASPSVPLREKAVGPQPHKPQQRPDSAITDAWITGEEKSVGRGRRAPSARPVRETAEKKSESTGVRI